jgi:dipeptidyl-peptidase-4
MKIKNMAFLLLSAALLTGCQAAPATEGDRVLASVPDNPGARFDPIIQDIEGWHVYIEPALLEGEHAAVGLKSIAMLRNHLERIAVLVPEPALSNLRQVGIWIEVNNPLTNVEPGPYHGGGRWLAENGYDVRLENCVHITRAASLLERHHMLKHPMVILHELVHAYHDEYLQDGYQNKLVLVAYKHAMDQGLYDKVLDYRGREVQAYAATNQMEYFAEASEAYFYRNDFFPFLGVELKQHDPKGYELMVEVWGKLE